MERRTSNIILIVKGNHNYGEEVTEKEAIAKYMSETCSYPEELYTYSMILRIVRDVVLDYIDSCDKSSALLWDYFDSICKDEIDKWISALKHIQVREGNKYINGFNENNIDVISENTGKKMFVD